MLRLLFFILLLSERTLAGIFIVNTALPSGTGSLRDALEKAAANGDRETDTIYFNITRSRDNIIKIPLNDLLPALSNNLVIDGTSQPSPPYGVSNAKVGILLEGTYSGTNLLYIFDARGVKDLKIYGLFFKGNVINPSSLTPPDLFYAIYLGGSTNIEIGTLGKGNVLSGWTRAIYDESNGRYGNSSNINISSNIFGLETDGVSVSYMGHTGGTATNLYSIILEKNSYDNIIGGADPSYGNIFNSSVADIILQGLGVNDRMLTIANNRIGIDFNYNDIPTVSGTAIAVSDINTFPGNPFLPPTPLIYGNYIGGRSRISAIILRNIKTNFLIRDNLIGYEDIAGLPDRNGNYGTGIIIKNCEQGTIANDTIRYWKNGAILLDTTYLITITDNSTYCNKKRSIVIKNWYAMNPVQRPEPFAYINLIDVQNGKIAGTSLPNAIIELFYNEVCPTCEGKTVFASIKADANGNWLYSGSLNGDNIIATATDIAKATSEYSMPLIDTSSLNIQPVFCSTSMGFICGLKILSGTKWHWEDVSGNLIGLDTCLKLVPAGKYFFKLSIGSSCEETFAFTIPDATPSININNVSVTPSRCGGNNGSVCGLAVINATRWVWEDTAGRVVSTNICFRNAAPGKYRCRVTGQGNCDVLSPFYEVKNKVPSINASNVIVKNPSCGKNNGSISGIKLTDQEYASIFWYDESGNVISSSTDLNNTGPGRYKLILIDSSAHCGDSTSFYNLAMITGPSMNVSGVKIMSATCGNKNGSISGITINNTTGNIFYQWTDSANRSVGSNLDLMNSTSGSYHLKIKDAGICDTVYSAFFNIPDRGIVPVNALQEISANSSCGLNNGSIEITQLSNNPAYFNFSWLRDSLQNIGAGLKIDSLSPAFYFCIAKDSNGCEHSFFKKQIIAIPLPLLNESSLKISADSCGLNTGSITGLKITGTGLHYIWIDQNDVISGNELSLTNIASGTYHLKITDQNSCMIQSRNFSIAAISTTLKAPKYTNLNFEIPRNGNLNLLIQNYYPGIYHLTDAVSGSLIDQNHSGNFQLNKVDGDKILNVDFNAGSCNSAVTTIRIKVFDDTRITIPNAFSPNNDGVNDEFRISVEGYFRLNYFKIFNRWGQMIFETKDVNLNWNGKRNGTALPVGTYYWILEGIDVNNKTIQKSGSVTLIR